MKNISTASAHWEDTLENGFGTISAESSQIFTETPYNFKARSESQAHITTQKNFWELLMQPVLVWHSQWF